MISYEKFDLTKSENCIAGVSYTLVSATQSNGETVKTADFPRFLKQRKRKWKQSRRGEFFLNFRKWMGNSTESGLIGFLVNYGVDESTVALYSDNALLRQGLSYGFRDWNAYIMRRRYDRMTIYRCAEKDFHSLLEKIKEDNDEKN